jgi:ABC-2 type transport system permease protein
MGYIAKPASTAITASASARRAIARLGVSGTGASVFLGATLVIVSLLVCLFAAAEIAAARASEADGHLDHLLVRPVRRTTWLAQQTGLVGVGLVGCGLLAALLAFAGGVIQHAGLGIGSLTAAGLNLTVPGLFVLGAGVVAFGVLPRATSTVVYAIVAWSFLVDLIGSLAGLNHWLLDTSLFHQIAAAPAEPVRWGTDAMIVGLGALFALAGAVAFARRDLAGA